MPAHRTARSLRLETDGQIAVFDVWESMEKFEAFGATLLPIMAELGADPGQPMVMTVHNRIDGRAADEPAGGTPVLRRRS